jgi:outer membrane autotransporter protein
MKALNRKTVLSNPVFLASAVALALTAGKSEAQEFIEGGTTVRVPGDRPSPWTIGSDLQIGRIGNGELIIENDGDVENAEARIGFAGGALGTVTVTGAGSTWTNSGRVFVGQGAGAGSLTIENGGIVSSAGGQLGAGVLAAGGPTSTVLVTGIGSAWINSSTLTVSAGAGSGILRIEAGASVSNAGAVVGSRSGNAGTVIVDGTGSSWTNAGTLILGAGDLDGGDGTLTITNGATVGSSDAWIAQGFNAVGVATVSGPGSRWDLSGNLDLGNRTGSDGALIIADGGVVASVDGTVAVNSGGTADVDINGTGSHWELAGALRVGSVGGIGTVDIADGGTVHSAIGNVGLNSRVSVSGSGSSWLADGALNVASGQLDVTDGAEVSSASSIITGTIGVATVRGAGSRWSASTAFSLQNNASLNLLEEGEVEIGGGSGVLDMATALGSRGTLNIGAGAVAGNLNAGTIRFGLGAGTVNFNHSSTDYLFAPTIEGAGTLNFQAGATRVSADSSGFTGAATVFNGARLSVDGALGGALAVQSGGTLAGTGSAGATTVETGGTLVGQQGQVLSFDSLTLAAGANVDVALGAPAADALFDVAGDLTLDGTLNVTDLGGFGAGVYRIFDYSGSLTDNGFELGTLPGGVGRGDLSVQTSVVQEVNLINATPGVLLNFWDGPLGDANDVIDGGDGIWDAGNKNWTDADGSINAGWNSEFAIFQGTPGTVSIDTSLGDIVVTGMQFATSGYTIDGDVLQLIEADTIIRVGDGTAAGSNTIATIASELSGPGRLVKTDFGTLILSGDSSARTAAAAIAGGTLRVTGSLGGALAVQSGGRLEGTGTVGATSLNAGGVIAPGSGGDSLGTLTIAGDFVGAGGSLQFGTALGDDASPTDRLVITGNTSGQAAVQVTNLGGSGAVTENGIRLIQVDGQSEAQFVLSGRAVAGAYEYFLFQGSVAAPSDGDWYLRSETDDTGPPVPVLRPEPGGYLANQAAAMGMFQLSLHDRLGHPGLQQGEHRFGAWVRTRRNQDDYNVHSDQLDVSSDISLLQLGVDLFGFGSGGRVGVMLAGGKAQSHVASEITDFTAKGKVEGTAAGVYASWFADPEGGSGFYADGWLQYGKFRNSVHGTGLAEERYDTHAWISSVEGGYTWRAVDSDRLALFVEPQLQAIYTDYRAVNHVESGHTVVRTEQTGDLSTRLGVRIYGHDTGSGDRRVQPFAEVNWWRQSNRNAMSFDAERVSDNVPQNRYEIKLGAQAQLGSGWAGWADVGAQAGAGEYRRIAGQIGLKYVW